MLEDGIELDEVQKLRKQGLRNPCCCLITCWKGTTGPLLLESLVQTFPVDFSLRVRDLPRIIHPTKITYSGMYM